MWLFQKTMFIILWTGLGNSNSFHLIKYDRRTVILVGHENKAKIDFTCHKVLTVWSCHSWVQTWDLMALSYKMIKVKLLPLSPRMSGKLYDWLTDRYLKFESIIYSEETAHSWKLCKDIWQSFQPYTEEFVVAITDNQSQ